MKKIISLSCLFIMGISRVPAQKIEAALNTLATGYPVEKVYIHYDKEYYVAGETIWFKVYLYSNGSPSSLSNNFYLQLINPQGKIISNKKYPVKGATVKGDIVLPDSLPQGYYHIRALTPGMLNTDRDFLYSKNIFVFNPSAKTGNVFETPKFPSLSVQFFPESGNLVAEILSVVAFKATDSLGLPVGIKGTIKTDDGTVITSFQTLHDGIGKVQFRPQAGKRYIAAVELDGQTGFYSLPDVAASGINLKIENETGGKMFLLSRSKKEKEKFDQLRVVAQMNNMVVYDSEINFENFFSVKGHLLTDSLPSGILHFTVFDKENKPLAERLTFINNGEFQSNAGIDIIKKDMTPRGENIVEVSFPDMAQRSFSVTVSDAEVSPVAGRENIISANLLTDDLEGQVYQPVFYFPAKNDTIRQTALDNLMLTNNWSRFSWKKILAGEFPERKYQDNYLVSVSGNLKDSKTNAPVSGGGLTVFIESEDSVNQNFEIIVGDDGRFTIDSLLFFGKAKLYYAYKTAQGREKPVNIFLTPQPVDAAVEALAYAVNTTDLTRINTEQIATEAVINRRYRSGMSSQVKPKELDPVVVESKTNKRPIDIVNEKYTSGAFTGMGKLNIDNINDPENDKSLSVYDYVKRSVKQLMEQGGNFVNRKNFSMFNASSDAWYAQQQKTLDSNNANGGGAGSAPGSVRFIDKGIREKGENYIIAVYVNESLADIGFLKTIRMDNVALIKFFEPGFIGAGMNGPGGSLCIYTKNEVNNDARIEKLDHVIYNGYSLAKEFHHPDYSLLPLKPGQEDNRTTLYWNPELYTDTNSKTARIRFYNNDFSKKLKIVVEGFDATGRLIHAEKIIGD
jgi:hypothetical protein